MIVGCLDFGVFEPSFEEPVVVGMSQLVHQHPGLFQRPRQEVAGVGHFDAMHLVGVHPVLAQPDHVGMISRATAMGSGFLNPDRNLAQPIDGSGRQFSGNLVELKL